MRQDECAASFAAMGTVVDLRVHGGDARATVEKCRLLVHRLEALLSRWQPDTDVAALNRSYGRWVAVHPHTDAVLACARRCARATDGAYDPVMGTLVDLWDVRSRMAAAARPLPDRAQVARALTHSGVRLLAHDERGRYRLPAGARVDLGGIAKGYAADQVRDLCARCDARGALVSIGRSSIAVLGCRPDGGAWRVGLRDADGGPSDRIGSVSPPDGSVSTSADYEQSVEVDGRRLHHVLDPRTGHPSASDLRAVTVVAPDGMLAETWSTAMLVRGLAWSAAACQQVAGIEAAFLTRDGLLVSPGLRDHVRRRTVAAPR